LARAKGDKASEPFLKRFVYEQIEEKNALELLAKVRMVEDSSAVLLALDSVFAQKATFSFNSFLY